MGGCVSFQANSVNYVPLLHEEENFWFFGIYTIDDSYEDHGWDCVFVTLTQIQGHHHKIGI